MERSRLTLLPVLLGLVFAACGGNPADAVSDQLSTSTTRPPQTLSGEVWVADWSFETTGEYFSFDEGDMIPNGYPCKSSEGFQDIVEGTRVVIRDSENNVVGAGPLHSEGLLFPGQDESYTIAGPLHEWIETIEQEGPCVFSFEITLTENPEFLSLTIAERSELVYTQDELESLDWDLALILG